MKKTTVVTMLALLAFTLTMCVASQAQTLLISETPHPQKYSLKRAILHSQPGHHGDFTKRPSIGRIESRIPGINSFGMAGFLGATNTRTALRGNHL